MFSRFMLNCRETARLLASSEWEQRGILTKLLVRLHLSMCVHCSRYAQDLHAIARAFREKYQTTVSGKQAQGLANRILTHLRKK